DRLPRRGQIRLAHDFKEWHARPVEVDEAVGARFDRRLMDKLPRILLHVDPLYPDTLFAAVRKDREVAVDAEGLLILGNLVALGEVRIVVVLPGENTLPVYRAARGQPRLDGKIDHPLVEHGQGPR